MSTPRSRSDKIDGLDRRDESSDVSDSEVTVDSGEATVVDVDIDAADSKAGLVRIRRKPSKKASKKRTIQIREITQFQLKAGRADLDAMGANGPYVRPKTRGDCEWCPTCQQVRDEADSLELVAEDPALGCGHRVSEVILRSRPCVFIACKFALYLDVSDTGSIVLNFPHLEPSQMPADESCVLDIAAKGGLSLEEIAAVTNRTRERIRQIETNALTEMEPSARRALGLDPDDSTGR